MTSSTSFILKTMYIIAWVVFIGLCIKAGVILYSFGISMHVNEIAAKNLYLGLDLSQLKTYSNGDYIALALCVTTITIFQALLFYFVIQISLKINLISPFHKKIGNLIKKISLLSFFIGIISKLSIIYADKFITQGMSFTKLNDHIGLGDAFLFFAGILYFIAQLFSKGIEMQSENELTI